MKVSKRTVMDVGIFVAVGIALAMGVLFFIGRERSLFEEKYTLSIRFRDISGLRRGAVVRLAGMNVGTVHDIHFPKEVVIAEIEVVMKINQNYQERIRKDSRASIQTQGLLGDKFISITTGTMGYEPLKNGDVMESEGVGGLSALTDKSQEMLDEMTLAARELRRSLEKLPLKNIDQASRELAIILGKVRQGHGTIGALLTDPSLYHDIRALLGHADRNKLLKNLIRATLSEQEKQTRQPVRE